MPAALARRCRPEAADCMQPIASRHPDEHRTPVV
jgi:hypothetical protein